MDERSCAANRHSTLFQHHLKEGGEVEGKTRWWKAGKKLQSELFPNLLNNRQNEGEEMVNVLYLCLFHRPYTTYNSALWGSCGRVGSFPPSLSTFSSSNHVSSLCVLSFYQPTSAICFSQADISLIDKITYWQMSCTPLLARAEWKILGFHCLCEFIHLSVMHQKGNP